MDKVDRPIDAMLKDVARSLPATQDVESSDEEIEGGTEGVAVFSRSDHLLSLGFHDSPLSVTNGTEDKEWERPKQELGNKSSYTGSYKDGLGQSSSGAETDVPGTKIDSDDMEWDKLRTDFLLQTSDHDVQVESRDPSPAKELLLIKAISELQSQNSTPGNDPCQSLNSADNVFTVCTQASTTSTSCTTVSSQPDDDLSPTHLLSTAILDGIEVSALDRALEEVEIGRATQSGDERLTRLHSPPKLAWGESPDLISQLKAIQTKDLELCSAHTCISERGLKTRMEAVAGTEAEALNVRDGAVSQTSQGEVNSDEDGKKTIFIDVRKPHKQFDNDSMQSVHSNSLEQSASESEESDDQQSWVLKRKQIKSTLSLTPNKLQQTEETVKSTSPSFAATKPGRTEEPKEEKNKDGSFYKGGQFVGEGEGSTESSLTYQEDKEIQEKSATLNGGQCEPPNNSPEVSRDSIAQSSNSTRITTEPVHPVSSGSDALLAGEHRLTLIKNRQHSTESFTLSSELSSFSDGELSPTKLIAPVEGSMRSIQNDNSVTGKGEKSKKEGRKKNKKKRKGRGKSEQKYTVVNDVDSIQSGSSPEVGSSALGRKQERGMKEGGKKKDQGGEKRKEGGRMFEPMKKGAPMKAKKASTMRIRFDSLTTSSDEERVIDSPCLSRVEEVAEPLPEDGKEVGESEKESKERLKQRLEYKILSKKPPAMFETPATEPLFHQDVSFSPALSHVDSSVGTDTLLVLPLSHTNGLISLPLSHLHISPEAHLALHSLFVTYLAVSAHSVLKKPPLTERLWSTSPIHAVSSHNKLPLRITSLYQSILGGQLSIIIGASLSPGRKRSMSYPSVVQRDTKRTAKTSGTVLCPLDAPRNPSAVELERIMCGLKLRDLLRDVMQSDVLGGPTEQTDMERVVISSEILNEIQPLLDMSAEAFFSVHSDTNPLTTPTSFYWHSLYQPSCLPTTASFCTTLPLQSTVCALSSESLSNPNLVFHAIHGAYDYGLSIAGMRLVYGETCLPLDYPGNDDTITDCPVVLVLCLRGPDAISRCMDLVGPEDYNLAKVTDPCSIVSRFGGPEYQPMQCTRTPYRVSATLSKWFGGRGCLQTGSVLGMTDSRTRSERRKRQRVRFSESDFESEDNLPPLTPDVSFPPLVANRPLLTVLPYEQVLIVVSPLLPPLCYSSILASCNQLGFDITGAKRVRLNSKRATVLDIPASMVSHFTPSSTPPSPDLANFSGHPLDSEPPPSIPPLPSLLLIVSRENAMIHTCPLRTAIVTGLQSLLSLNPQLTSHIKVDYPVGALLHTLPYNVEKLKVLGSFASTTVTSLASLPPFAPEWEREGEKYGEEISFLAITQPSGLVQAVQALQLVFGVKGEKRWDEGLDRSGQVACADDEETDRETQNLGRFELLGMKLIPQLSRFHAKQLCPIPSSDHTYQEAIQLLSDSPALILVLRGITCNHRLQTLLRPSLPRLSSRQSLSTLSLLMSNSLSQAFHYTTMFFTDKELFCDPTCWTLLSFVPSSWARADILHDMQRPPLQLYSVLVVRGGEWRVLVKVVDRLCRSGFEVCGVTMRVPEEGRSEERNEQSREDILRSTREPINTVSSEVAVCVSRQNAVWYLNHELRPFKSSTKQQNTLHCPTVFSDAVSLVQRFFPRGVCGPDGAVASDYEVKPKLIDDFSGLRTSLSTPSLSSSPLTEISCIILPPSHLTPPPHHPTPHYLQLLELLTVSGFTITGIQMTLFSQRTADSLSAIGVDTKDLVSGPCLLLLLQRDNAASCFHHILKSSIHYSVRGVSSSDIDEMLAGAIVPDSTKMAKAILAALLN